MQFHTLARALIENGGKVGGPHQLCVRDTAPGGELEQELIRIERVDAVSQFLAGHAGFQAAFEPLFTSMFLHAGLMHLLGNMLFLWIFGDNVEDYFGHAGYLFFYVVCGIGSGLVQVLLNLNVSPLPAIGASGAISGGMGAYILLFPRHQILTFFFIFLIPLPAFLILGYWFVLQFLEGVGQLGMAARGGVAFWAHIGGFLLGLAITALVRKK